MYHVWGKGAFHTEFWWGDLRKKDHLEDLSIDRRIILKWIFSKRDGTWTWLIRFRIGTGDELMKTSEFHKMRGISWLTENLLVPEDSAAWGYLLIYLVVERQQCIPLAELVGLVGLGLTTPKRFVSWKRGGGVEKGYNFIGGLPDCAFRSSDRGGTKVKTLDRRKVIIRERELLFTA